MAGGRRLSSGLWLLLFPSCAVAFLPGAPTGVGSVVGRDRALSLTLASKPRPASDVTLTHGPLWQQGRGFRKLAQLRMSASEMPMEAMAFAAKSEVLAALAGVEDPFRADSIVKLAAVKDVVADMESGKVSFQVEIGAPDLSGEVKEACTKAVSEISWVKEVEVAMAALPPDEEMRAASVGFATGLDLVKNVVVCASCKGGVGKSTTSVNLAFSLSKMGHKVGILDVDVYGPSLPTMVIPDKQFNPHEDIVGNDIYPVMAHGVKMMSVGFINPQDSFVLRGAKVSPLVQQLVSTTAWGDLDYLIIDMPPGTGDIHLTLSQMSNLQIDAAVIVTTPQRLSFVDVVKGIEMFDKVGIPSVAVVENMAYVDSTEIQEKIEKFAAKHDLANDAKEELLEIVDNNEKIFGDGFRQRLLDMWGIDNSYNLPLNKDVAKQADAGLPYVLAHPDTELSQTFLELASAVVAEVKQVKEEDSLPTVVYDPPSGMIVINGEQKVAPAELRRLCRSPANDPKRIPESIAPVDIVPLGRYAVSILWTDGHQSLMPYRAFVQDYKK